jgi:hypothetical protein
MESTFHRIIRGGVLILFYILDSFRRTNIKKIENYSITIF